MKIVVNDRKLRDMVKAGALLWGLSSRFLASECKEIREVCWLVAKKRSTWQRKFFGEGHDNSDIRVLVDDKELGLWDAIFYYRIASVYLRKYKRK